MQHRDVPLYDRIPERVSDGVVMDHPTILIVEGVFYFFFQAEDGIRDLYVTGVQTCALPILRGLRPSPVSVSSRRNNCPSDAPSRTSSAAPGGAFTGGAAGTEGACGAGVCGERSEERRVGKEGRCRGWADHGKRTEEQAAGAS